MEIKIELIKIEYDTDEIKKDAIWRRRMSDLQDFIHPPPDYRDLSMSSYSRPETSLFDIVMLSEEGKKEFIEILTREYEVEINIK